jgi:hypothetical protein
LLTATPDTPEGGAEDREGLTPEMLHPLTAMSALASAKRAATTLRASLRKRDGHQPDLPELS